MSFCHRNSYLIIVEMTIVFVLLKVVEFGLSKRHIFRAMTVTFLSFHREKPTFM